MGRRVLVFGVAVMLLAATSGTCVAPDGESSMSGTTAPALTSVSQSSTTTSAHSVTTTIPVTTTTTIPVTSTAPSPAEQLLSQMELREKVAQILMITIDGTTLSPGSRALLADDPPGGILLLERNVIGAAQLTAFTAAMQQAVATGRPGLELFIAVDQEGGSVQRIHQGVPELPSARMLGDTSSPEAAGLLAEETADGLLAMGVNMNLAPVADVVSSRASFLYRRSYAADPTKVAAFVSAVTETFTRAGLIAVVKHFPGHGSTSGDTHEGTAVATATRADFQTVHLPPFRAAIKAGVEGVMVAHLIAAAYDADRPASQSQAVVEGLLRGELGFTGLIISDDLRMVGSGDAGPGQTAVASLAAGCDLLVCTGTDDTRREVLDAVVSAVQAGRLPLSRLNQAVLGVLDLKFRHGLATFQPGVQD